jgi:prepilin-type N-terminal cleavage/methylation domain-containing protein
MKYKTITHNKKAFTLAEVLIALVVIGIVAAITVPTLISNYKKQEASSRLKKFYSTMQQVVIKAKADGNDWENWADDVNQAVGTENFSKKYILPYLSYNKYQNRRNSDFENSSTQIFFNDGSYFDVLRGTCIDLIFDINGDKKPNVTGRDIFRFIYCPVSAKTTYYTSKISPYKTIGITKREQAKSSCKSDARYCTSLLFYDNWEFKSDYPYKI